MTIDIDLLKGICEFIDWIQKKGTSVINHIDRNKLNSIINSITDLVTNKRIYLNRINNTIQTGDQEQVELEIKNALSIAEKGTKELLMTIRDSQFKDSDIYRILNSKALVLANIKLTEVERLKNLIGEGELSKNVIEILSKYESQWDNIGVELEKIKKTIANNG